MITTAHALTAVAINNQISNLPLIFGISFASHLILDMIPHGDIRLMLGNEAKEEDITVETFSTKNQVNKFIFFAFLDIAALVISAFWLYYKGGLKLSFIITAFSGAILLDVLGGLHKLTKWNFLYIVETWHLKLHRVIAKYLPKKDINPAFSVILQIVFIIVVLKALS